MIIFVLPEKGTLERHLQETTHILNWLWRDQYEYKMKRGGRYTISIGSCPTESQKPAWSAEYIQKGPIHSFIPLGTLIVSSPEIKPKLVMVYQMNKVSCSRGEKCILGTNHVLVNRLFKGKKKSLFFTLLLA